MTKQILPGMFLFFSNTTGFTPRIITWLQKRVFTNIPITYLSVTHCASCIDTPEIIREAIIPKDTIHSLSEENPKDKLEFIIEPIFLSRYTKEERKKFMDSFIKKELKIYGQIYAVWDLVGIFIWTVFYLCGKKLDKNPIRGGKICTKDVFMTKLDLEKAFGIIDPVNQFIKDSNNIYPARLLELFNQSEYYKVIYGS